MHLIEFVRQHIVVSIVVITKRWRTLIGHSLEAYAVVATIVRCGINIDRQLTTLPNFDFVCTWLLCIRSTIIGCGLAFYSVAYDMDAENLQ